jgi:hypothetical protein
MIVYKTPFSLIPKPAAQPDVIQPDREEVPVIEFREEEIIYNEMPRRDVEEPVIDPPNDEEEQEPKQIKSTNLYSAVAIPPIPTRLELTSGEEVKYKRRFKNNGAKRWPETTRLVQVPPPPDDSDNSVFIGALLPDHFKHPEFRITAPREAGLHTMIWRFTFNDEDSGDVFYFGPEIIFRITVEAESELEA